MSTGVSTLPPLRSLRGRLVVTAVLVVAAVGAVLAGMLLGDRSYRKATDASEHSGRVLATANANQRLVIDLETGVRGYLLTGRTEFLEPYRNALRSYRARDAALERLVRNDGPQERRARALSAEIERYVRTYARPLVDRTLGRRLGGQPLAAGEALAVTRDGKRRLDAIRRRFDAFLTAEARIAAARSARTERDEVRAEVVGTACAVGALLVIVAAFVALGRTVVRPIRRVAAAADRLAGEDLHARVSVDGVSEARALALAFNRMADALRASQETLTAQNEELMAQGDELAGALAQEQLAHATLTATLESITDVFYALDADWRYTHLNGAAERVLHLDRQELLGAVLWDVFPSALGTEWEEGLRRAAASEQPVAFEVPAPRFARWFAVRAFPRPAGGLAVFMTDVTERRRSESALAERTELLARERDTSRALLEAINDGIALVGHDGTVLQVNDRLCLMSGYGAEDLVGPASEHAWWQWMSPLGAPAAEGAPVVADLLLERRGGLPLPVLVTRTPVGDGSGVLVTFKDIGERKRAEEEREAALDREREQNARLRELDRIKDELVGVVSHELRTPLTSIMGYVELLLEDGGALDETQRGFLTSVRRNAARLAKLVEDLLLLSRIDADRLSLRMEPVDLSGLVVREAAVFARDVERKALRVDLEIAPDVTLLGDEGRLAQAVDNLLSNAVKFTPAGGRIGVGLRRVPEGLELVVEDSGVGIPAAELDRLFERFFRASSAAQHQIQGTGLGLAITKAIVEGHGGRIEVASRPGGGTRFRVGLPAVEPALAA